MLSSLMVLAVPAPSGRGLLGRFFKRFLCWGWGAFLRTLFLPCPGFLILFSRFLIYIKLTCPPLKYYPSVAVYRGVLVEGITAFF